MTGRLAAATSSRRRTGVLWARRRRDLGSSAASLRIAAIDVGERVERLLGLGLGRLDHQRLVDQQREVHGARVKAEVQQALGQVERLQFPARASSARRIWGTRQVREKQPQILRCAQDDEEVWSAVRDEGALLRWKLLRTAICLHVK